MDEVANKQNSGNGGSSARVKNEEHGNLAKTGFYKSPIGLIEISCDDSGINSVRFVNDSFVNDGTDNQFREDGKSYSKIIAECIEQLEEYFQGRRKEFDVKLSVGGTDFQKSVYNSLMKIDYGKTCSYKDIANDIGKDRAVRAVGSSNGKNKIAIIIPCHRVVNASGKIGGYNYGPKRKEWLLNFENSNISLS